MIWSLHYWKYILLQLLIMEGELEANNINGTKTPLLEGWKLSGSGRRSSRRFSRHNSFTSLRRDFLSRLPDKVINSFVIDSEASYIINNLSISSDLTKGSSLSLRLFGSGLNMWLTDYDIYKDYYMLYKTIVLVINGLCKVKN